MDTDYAKEFVQKNRNKASAHSKAAHDAVANIGKIPVPLNYERRSRCRLDLHAFLREYFPESTGLSPFGDAQIRAIKRIERAILKGGRFLNLFPRGFSKSTISENAQIWCVVYGHRSYGVFFGAKQDDASGAIESIKKELTENDRLAEDFPEVVRPCQALEGKPQRCGSQTQTPRNIDYDHIPPLPDGEDPPAPRLTHIEWTAETIVMPSIEVPDGWGEVPPEEYNWDDMKLSPASGAIIRTKGLMAASRGLRFKRPDGRQIRPDFCVVDDPQTEESALSPVQVAKRLKVIQRSILRLGGHGRAVACVINATIMEDGDLPDTLADADKHPEWEVERIKMMLKMPSQDVIDKHWLGEYARIRRSYDRGLPGDREKSVVASTEYYIANRAEMDDGSIPSWPDIPLESHEVSAVQHAMNILVDDGEEVFSSECQNEPKRMIAAGIIILSEKELAEKTSGHQRGVVPEGCGHVTFHIDVHDSILYWAVAAISDDMTGGIIDYGTWPEQPAGRLFNLRTAKITLRRLYGLREEDPKSVEEGIQQGVADCIEHLCKRKQWITPGGVVIPVSRGMVDMGYKPEQVAAAIRQSEFRDRLVGARGVGFTPHQIPMPEYDTSPGKMRRAGPDPKSPRWYVPAGNTYGIQIVRSDTNHWKDTLQARFVTPAGTPGAWTLFGNHRIDHRQFCAHLTAQEPKPLTGGGRTINQWTLRPNREDHWWDNAVGCLVAASYDGCRLPGWSIPAPKPKTRRRLADLRKEALARKGRG